MASCLAILTNQTPCRSSCWCRRTISRKRRRTRLRTTAPPSRLEVTNPARHGPEISWGIAFNNRSLPRCVIPFRFTRSNSRRCVRRRVLGKENELTFVGHVPTTFICPGTSCLKTEWRCVDQHSVQKKSSTENRGKTSKKRVPALLRRGRFGWCFLGASGRIRVASGSFRCGGTRYFSGGRGRRRGSRTCRRSDRFSFLLARCEKRAHGQNADVFLHSWRRTLL